MLTPSPAKRTKKRPNRRGRKIIHFPGIVALSRELDLDRAHVFRVLKYGFPDHHRIAERYAALSK